jgi:hypothetical protein
MQNLRCNIVRLRLGEHLIRTDRTFLSLDVRAYCPSVLRRPRFQGLGEDLDLLEKIFPSLFQDELALTATIMFGMFVRDLTISMSTPMSREVQGYYRRTIQLLRKRLTEKNALLSDTMVMMTLGHIIGADVCASTNYNS